MNKNNRKTVLLDLDGVLNDYCGVYNENFIPPLKKEAENFLKELNKEFDVIIFSARNILLVQKWINDNNLSQYIHSITNKKVPAFLHIDDRCLQFKGNYQTTIKQIKNFKVYWEK